LAHGEGENRQLGGLLLRLVREHVHSQFLLVQGLKKYVRFLVGKPLSKGKGQQTHLAQQNPHNSQPGARIDFT